MLKIKDITKFTLQDFPNKTACIIWFAECNMRCQYCYNIDLLFENSKFLTEEKVLEFLESRRTLLDGVVLSGGECSLGGKEAIKFIEKIKQIGFKVKIDTNGLNFLFVKELLDDNLIDYIALDFKAPEEKFDLITGTKNQFENYMKTFELVLKNNVEKEIRTTIHIVLLNEVDLNSMIDMLDIYGYDSVYYIQKFKSYGGKTLNSLVKPSRELDFNKIKKPKNFTVEYRNFNVMD